MVANIYYVGTEDLATYLITDPTGHVVINSGLASTNEMILAGIRNLGFRIQDVRVILTNQAHYDHAEGMAELVRLSGAKVFATPPDAAILESGGKADPAGFSGFAPVKVDRILKDGEEFRVGATALKVHYAYGHTPGSSSYEMKVRVDGQERTVVFANMGTVVMPLSNPKYPSIVNDFRETFRRQRAMKPDIWFATHGSQFGLAEKYKTRQYADPAGYQAAVDKYEKLLKRQVKIELGQ
jgi:metallo-beta-lactamase class B